MDLGSRFELETAPAADGDGMCFRMRGHFTSTYTSDFSRMVKIALGNGVKQIELDFSDLTYLDSLGIAAISSSHQQCLAHDARLKIVNPRKLVRHLFVSVKLDQILDIGPTLE